MQSLDSWGGEAEQAAEKDDAYLKMQAGLQKTAEKLNNKRIETLNADVSYVIDQAAKKKERSMRGSRMGAAAMFGEAGIDSISQDGTEGSDTKLNFMKKSTVKQDGTLDHFRDRRPNKYSGMRKPITNDQKQFKMRWKTLLLLWLIGASTGVIHKFVAISQRFILKKKYAIADYVTDELGYGIAVIVWFLMTILWRPHFLRMEQQNFLKHLVQFHRFFPGEIEHRRLAS